MVTEKLIAAVEQGDTAACVSLLRGLDEVQRRALYPSVSATLRSEEMKFDFHRNQAVRLALIGTATLSELKKISAWRLDTEQASAILRDRRPGWLADWAEFELARNLWQWPLVRTLVREKLISKLETEPYTVGMVVAPGRFKSVSDFLEADPELLTDQVWLLFVHEGGGEFSLAAYDKYVPERSSWQAGFCALAAEGKLDRARLLAASLDALMRDFAPFRAGWFSRFHNALRPTPAERITLRDRYLDLLASRVPATVSFAMKALVDLEKADALNIVAISERLASALEARDKGTVARALRLLAKAARAGQLRDVEAIAAMAARALSHESPDVQAQALELVGDRNHLIQPYLNVLAPSLRPKHSSVAEEPPHVMPQPEAEAAPIVPVPDCEELVELFAAVLENQGPPEALERVLDGVSRMPPEERLTKALAKRAERLAGRAGSVPPRTLFAQLALAWIYGQRMAPPNRESNLADFLHWRVWHVAETAVERQWRPLLSLPTWPDGRLQPEELERRIQVTGELRDEAFKLDLAQARLRAGEKKAEAWARIEIRWKKRTWEASGSMYSHHVPSLVTEHLGTVNRFTPGLLSLAQCRESLEMKRWSATVCPHWREGWFAAGCRDLGYNIDWWEANWAHRAYLEPLLNRETQMRPMASLLMALGLGAKEPGESLLAGDALIAAVQQGRMNGAMLGQALAEAASSGAIKFSRWSKGLARVSQTGLPVACVLFDALEILFASGHTQGASDIHKLIELQLQLAHLTRRRLTESRSVENLRRVLVGGKTKRVRDELLGM